MAKGSTPVEIFCCYTHEDETWRQKLETHLSLLRRQGLVSFWHDRQLLPGTDWAKAIDMHLETASVILLLVSSDFFASDYCYGIEMRRALEREATGETRVIPILVRPVDWKGAPFAHLQALPSDAKPLATWQDEDTALADIVAGIRCVIEDTARLSAGTPRAALPAIWNIPYPRNPFFLGRDNLLSRIRMHVQAGQTAALSQPQAISGLGGIGKTQLATEYAYRFQEYYRVVLWVHADTRESLISGYVAIAGQLNLPEKDEQDYIVAIQAVRSWLQRHQEWLLILDNADDLDLLPVFLPPAPGGHILITTRAWEMQRLAQRIEVEALPREQGALLLLQRAGLLAPHAPLEHASIGDRTLAIQLAQQIGGLPLALDQAGAYLEATGMSLEQYQQVYQQHRRALHQRRGARVPDHPEPVATTWSLAFQRIEQRHPAAADLLRLCAFLAPDAIPEKMLTLGASHLGPVLKPVMTDPFLLGEAAAVLRTYSLLSRDPRTGMLSVHRLVQAVLYDDMEEALRQQWTERTVRMVVMALPGMQYVYYGNDDLKNRQIYDAILGQAQVCAEWMLQDDLHIAEMPLLLADMGLYFEGRNLYQMAELLLVRALQLTEQEQGRNHPRTAIYLDALASLYEQQGKNTQAETLYQRAFAIYEQNLGPEDWRMAPHLDKLAHFYEKQGKDAQAEQLYERAIPLMDVFLGYESATPLMDVFLGYESATPLMDVFLGPDFPYRAILRTDLAALYERRGKNTQAELLYQQALVLEERRLGLEHPKTAMYAEILYSLAQLREAEGHDEEAKSLYVNALAVRSQVFGAGHPKTVETRKRLIALLHTMGWHEEAAQLEVAQSEP